MATFLALLLLALVVRHFISEPSSSAATSAFPSSQLSESGVHVLSPAAVGARFPALARNSDGRIAMVWTEKGADSIPEVRMAIQSSNMEWGIAHTVVRSESLFVNFADIPKVVWLPNGELVVAWLQRSGSGKYDYGIRLARSSDDGQSWQGMSPPHDLAETGEHGFVSLVAVRSNNVGYGEKASREYSTNKGVSKNVSRDSSSSDSEPIVGISFLNGHTHGASHGATQLVYTELSRNGLVASTRVLDLRVCDCCQTAIAASVRGNIVTYRDRSDSDIRDIYTVRESANGWSSPVAVSNDRWMITGCPVNGPAISANGEVVSVAWFSAANDSAKVQLALSTNGGETFSPAIRIDEGAPAGHVAVITDSLGNTFVSWLERSNDSLSVSMRRIASDHTLSSAFVLAKVSGLRATGWPAIVMDSGGRGLFAAWTVSGSPSTIATQHVPASTFR